MIPTDDALILLSQDSYSASPAGEVYDVGPDRLVVTRLPGVIVLAIRGTANLAGWWLDFRISQKTIRAHPKLGPLEAGFAAGADAIYGIAAPLVAASPGCLIVIVGHSRGAIIAPILAALFAADGVRVTWCCCIEKPWGNGAVMRALLDQAGVRGVEWWHGDDPVPLVPAELGFVMANFPIKHFGRWTLDPFDSHLMGGIVADLHEVAALQGVPVA
ncbi:MAG TPA: hypothetical protein VL614_14805 [Acetobacteraceae bacterium]|jgi:hypothetical protein|nr:hypothetical protein [Acetobacteraceae bacterium]